MFSHHPRCSDAEAEAAVPGRSSSCAARTPSPWGPSPRSPEGMDERWRRWRRWRLEDMEVGCFFQSMNFLFGMWNVKLRVSGLGWALFNMFDSDFLCITNLEMGDMNWRYWLVWLEICQDISETISFLGSSLGDLTNQNSWGICQMFHEKIFHGDGV